MNSKIIFWFLKKTHGHSKPPVGTKIRKFEPCAGAHIRKKVIRWKKVIRLLRKEGHFFFYFFPFCLKIKIIYFLCYIELERLKFCDSNGIFFNCYNLIDHEISTKNLGNLRDSLS